MLQEILRINPAVKIIASPWSAPPWMKTNGSYVAGRLKPESYSAYARYFVKYVETMRGHGIHVSAVTPQNEPHNPRNEPSMVMTAAEQADFIKGYLGPELRKGAPETEILCWDHNCDGAGLSARGAGGRGGARLYRRRCLAFVQRIAGGDVARAGAVSGARKCTSPSNGFPPMTISWARCAGIRRTSSSAALRNWSRTALEWNLASDPRYALHTRLGAVGALGGVTIGATVKHRRGAAGRLYHRRHDQAKPRILSDGALGAVHPAGVGAGSFKRGGSASQRGLPDA